MSQKAPGAVPVLYTSKTDCCGCTACSAVCPKGAVRMAADEQGFLYPQIDAGLCVGCGRCAAVCPLGGMAAPQPGAKKETPQ